MTSQSVTRTVVQLVLVDETGDSYYRMRWPAAHLAAQRPDWCVINLDARAEERFEFAESADLLVIYQSQDYDLIPIINLRRKQGKKTIVEYNDNFYEPPPSTPVYEQWTSPLIWQSYEALIECGDALIVTGEGLHQLFKAKFTREIVVLENHLPEPPKDFNTIWRDPTDKLCIGWGGSLGHAPDLFAMLPSLRALALENPKIHLKFMGNESLKNYIGLPQNRYDFVSWGSIHDYYRFWDGVHIGVGPLLDIPYNHCRSDIKAVEMAAHGVLPILSNLTPYSKFIAATSAPHFSTFAEMSALIRSYVTNLTKLRTDAERCHSWVSKNRVSAQRRERVELYERCMPQSDKPYTWKLPAGYHEIKGKTKELSRTHEQLQVIQELLARKDYERAFKILETACRVNPIQPELNLARLKVLRAMRSSEIGKALSTAIKQFPRDLRFKLYAIETSSDQADRVAQLTDLVFQLRQDKAGARYFEEYVLQLFHRLFLQGDPLESLGIELLELYPDRARILLALAHGYEQRGKRLEAHTYFKRAVELTEITNRNREILSPDVLPELRSWELALRS